ncbi:lasso peptide biosynthesis B2 protein [Streptomyces sp. MAR4 CNX-425]|uniref:lasso peptide biosynthesis B2 protein n=1 Tax=Streptomyces sp. MAR4 CNX-425 TaxID=3406343 RepID=UPI003B50091F
MSLAAFLAVCLRGRAVGWCIGCRFDPCESHAWIEADNRPVGEPEPPDRPFHLTLRV